MKKTNKCPLQNCITKAATIDYKSSAKWLVIIPILLIALTFILTYFVGFNIAPTIDNRYELTIDFGTEIKDEKLQEYKTTIDDTLAENSLSAIDYKLQGQNIYTAINVTLDPKYTEMEPDKMTEIIDSIETYLQTNVSEIIEVESMNYVQSGTNSAILRTFIALSIICVAIFVYMWIRYNFATALIGGILPMFTAVLNVVMYGLFRLPVDKYYLGIVFVSVIIAIIAYAYFADKVREMVMDDKALTNNEYAAKANTLVITNLSMPLCVIMGIVILLFVIMLFVNIGLAWSLLSLVLSIAFGVFAALYVAVSVWCVSYNRVKDNRIRARKERIAKAQAKAEKKKTQKAEEENDNDKIVV